MFLFLSGTLMMGCFAVAAFFVRYWLRTRDRFFIFFASAWILLGAERLGLAIANQPEEPAAHMYFLRLAAFLLIIIAVLDKNRARAR